ncbi:MAG TPA: histidine phosphatase family protein [Cyclobacteriaceae bacterium]
MKQLIIVRHAKSSWDNPLLSDFDRPLNKRGETDAPRMGKKIKDRKIVPDLMISSPANRAITTCKVFCDALEFPVDRIHIEKKLYHASEDYILSLLKTVKDHPRDKDEVVIIFGHNPGLTEFTNSLFSEDIDNIPTCGVVGGVLSIPSWKELKWGCGKLEFFDYPKKD